MKAIKAGIKKLLIGKAEKNYKKRLKSQKMDYDKWIRGLEGQNKLENKYYCLNKKNLTIDEIEEVIEGKNDGNDSELAKTDDLCQLYELSKVENSSNCTLQYLLMTPAILPVVCRQIKGGQIKADGVILKLFDGILAEDAIAKINFQFENNEALIVIYSDEDVINQENIRQDPWFKPDWAPDDFLSYFYFGGLIAIRPEALATIPMKKGEDIYRYIYKVLVYYGAFSKHEAVSGKLDASGTETTSGGREKYSACPVGHISEILFHSYGVSSYDRVRKMELSDAVIPKLGDVTVSVIIPSKDHPDILFRCIDSFIDRSHFGRIKYEFIVVDNGSNSKNRKTIETLREDYLIGSGIENFKYIYEKSDFNFSYMCNLGARNASGGLLLFLNDDMEIIDSDWLKAMCEKALLPYAGAVGAKLLYPKDLKGRRGIIQHAGITNLRIGPAHKLQFLSDNEDHYFGRNRYVHDMMGVTGACLMLRREVFDEVGGFDENLAVAFNDVDLCYTIYEHGYYNIERNDIKLLHHESLSRGNDSDSEEKMLRLSKEKDYLYEKHQELYGKDPFYNVNLTTDMLEIQYAPKYHYQVDLDQPFAEVWDITDEIGRAQKDSCVRVGMEAAMDIYKWKYGVSREKGKVEPLQEDLGFYFQGYTFVIGANNACYLKTLLLENLETKQVYGIKINSVVRTDIENNIPDQINVGMTGYTAKLGFNAVPKGHYRFGMYMKDTTSTQRLYNWSNWTLEV